jgi:hypothetical protein
MNRRSFFRKFRNGFLGLSATGPVIAKCPQSGQNVTHSDDASVPRYIQKWIDNLYAEVRDPTIMSDWEYLPDYERYDNNYGGSVRIEKIPIWWNPVKTFRIPDYPPKESDPPRTAYAYCEIETSIGDFRLDYMWRWHWDNTYFWASKTDKAPMLNAFGTMALIWLNGRKIGISGRVYGANGAWAEDGYQKGKYAFSFDHPVSMHIDFCRNNFFELWKG